MATKLKNLKIKKVDFVDEGANPDAHIKLYKNKDGVEQLMRVNTQKSSGVWKRLLSFIGKAAGIGEEEIDTAIEEITKGNPEGFTDKLNEFRNRKIADEIWDICYALQNAFCSILNDGELDSMATASAMQESLDEFHTLAQECIQQWSTGKEASIVKKKEEVTETDLEIMKSAVERLNHSIEKAAAARKEGWKQINENLKGEEKMEIDKSKLTDAERAFLESIEKRYGTYNETVSGNGGTETVPALTHAELKVTKSVIQPAEGSSAPSEETDSIYKGLHPAVRAELEGLKKFREDAETKELSEIAKKYAIIGKKEDELVPLFKSLKAAGGTAYNDMIAVLDQAVATVEKSGAFSEIGKSGHGSSTVGAAEAKIETIAKGYMEKDSSLDYASAIAKAWEDNPELMDEYEAEAGF